MEAKGTKQTVAILSLMPAHGSGSGKAVADFEVDQLTTAGLIKFL